LNGKMVIMPLDAKDKITIDSLETRYTYHAPNPLQVEQYRSIRAGALRLAQIIVEECPSSAERSSALTHLDIAVMMANAAIARQQPATE
jgi:hypothetical protein